MKLLSSPTPVCLPSHVSLLLSHADLLFTEMQNLPFDRHPEIFASRLARNADNANCVFVNNLWDARVSLSADAGFESAPIAGGSALRVGFSHFALLMKKYKPVRPFLLVFGPWGCSY